MSTQDNIKLVADAIRSRIFDEEIRSAFRVVRHGRSVDDCVIDENINGIFINECLHRSRLSSVEAIDQAGNELWTQIRDGIDALSNPEFASMRDNIAAALNVRLLNLRKTGKMSQLAPTRRGQGGNIPRDEDCKVAAEMAARFIEDKYKATVDDIICHPGLRSEFDAIAEMYYPGKTPFFYRKCLLGLRKCCRFKPEHIKRALETPIYMRGSLEYYRAHLSNVPNRPGVYVISNGAAGTIYIGETENLSRRIGGYVSGVTHSVGLAEYLGKKYTRDEPISIEVFLIPTKAMRLALESELIRTRHPIFNLQR